MGGIEDREAITMSYQINKEFLNCVALFIGFCFIKRALISVFKLPSIDFITKVVLNGDKGQNCILKSSSTYCSLCGLSFIQEKEEFLSCN